MTPRQQTECRHRRARGVWWLHEGEDRLEFLACPDCRRQWLPWIYPIAPGRLMIGYNFSPVVL